MRCKPVEENLIVSDRDKELMEAAVSAFLYLVPALAEEIDRRIPVGSTAAEQRLHRQQKGWAELCHSANRSGIDPIEFARQVVAMHEQTSRTRSLN